MSRQERVLGRLDKVKSKGKGKFEACCPAHDDRHPSLAIAFVPDGRVLLHCRAGCDILNVLDAAGLDWSDVSPEETADTKHRLSLIHHVQARPQKPKSAPHHEVVVALGESQVARGDRLSSTDKEALKAAIVRKARQSVA